MYTSTDIPQKYPDTVQMDRARTCELTNDIIKFYPALFESVKVKRHIPSRMNQC